MTKRKAKQLALIMVASAIESIIGGGGSFDNTPEADKEKIIKEIDEITNMLYKRSEQLKDK